MWLEVCRVIHVKQCTAEPNNWKAQRLWFAAYNVGVVRDLGLQLLHAGKERRGYVCGEGHAGHDRSLNGCMGMLAEWRLAINGIKTLLQSAW